MDSKSPPPKKPTTGEDLKKVWQLGPLGKEVEKKTFDPAEKWLKDPKDVKHSKGGKKRTRRMRKKSHKRK